MLTEVDVSLVQLQLGYQRFTSLHDLDNTHARNETVLYRFSAEYYQMSSNDMSFSSVVQHMCLRLHLHVLAVQNITVTSIAYQSFSRGRVAYTLRRVLCMDNESMWCDSKVLIFRKTTRSWHLLGWFADVRGQLMMSSSRSSSWAKLSLYYTEINNILYAEKTLLTYQTWHDACLHVLLLSLA